MSEIYKINGQIYEKTDSHLSAIPPPFEGEICIQGSEVYGTCRDCCDGEKFYIFGSFTMTESYKRGIAFYMLSERDDSARSSAYVLPDMTKPRICTWMHGSSQHYDRWFSPSGLAEITLVNGEISQEKAEEIVTEAKKIPIKGQYTCNYDFTRPIAIRILKYALCEADGEKYGKKIRNSW